MVKGILSGLAMGAITGIAVVSVLSLYAPLAKEEARDDVEPVAETPSVELTPEPEESTVAVVDEPAVEEEPTAAVEPEAPVPLVDESASDVETVETVETEEPATDAAVAETVAEEPVVDTDTEVLVEETAVEVVAEEEPAPTVLADAPDAVENQAAPAETDVVLPQSSEVISERAVSDLRVATESDAPVETVETPERGVLPQVQTAEPDAPTSSDAPVLASVTQSLTPEINAPGGLSLPQADDVPAASGDVAERPAPVAEPEAETDAQTLPTPVASDTPITLDVPQIDNPVAGVVTNRLPSVTEPEPEAEPTEDAETPDTVIAPDASEVGALVAYAASVEGDVTGALFSVILVDDGTATVPRSELMSLDLPFSIAIDPTSPNAAQVAAQYRSAGIEVLTLVNDLPASAVPSDVSVAIEGYSSVLPESIAIMDPVDARIQSNRSLLQPVLGAIRDTGQALVTYDQGLNSAQQAARREGIPEATVFRLLDADDEEAPRIKRYLNRAAFNAARDGSVVVLGRSRPETVRAILEWALDEKGADINMVPVSYIMLQDQN